MQLIVCNASFILRINTKFTWAFLNIARFIYNVISGACLASMCFVHLWCPCLSKKASSTGLRAITYYPLVPFTVNYKKIDYDRLEGKIAQNFIIN